MRRHLTIPTSDLPEHHVHARRPVLKISHFWYLEEIDRSFPRSFSMDLLPFRWNNGIVQNTNAYTRISHRFTSVPSSILVHIFSYLNSRCVSPISPPANEALCLLRVFHKGNCLLHLYADKQGQTISVHGSRAFVLCMFFFVHNPLLEPSTHYHLEP